LLDPQQEEFPPDISCNDYKHYFEPIGLTDETGGPAEWLKPYIPQLKRRVSKASKRTIKAGPGEAEATT